MFSNIPFIKDIDFEKEEIYKKFQIKTPTMRREFLYKQFEKLNILMDFYSKKEFQSLVFHKLNVE